MPFNLRDNPALKLAGEVVKILFFSCLIFYLSAAVIERLWPGFVSHTLKLDHLLIAVIIFGLANLFLPSETNGRSEYHKRKWTAYILIGFFALVGAFLVFFQIRNFGNISLVVTFLSYFTVIIFGYAILHSDRNYHHDE